MKISAAVRPIFVAIFEASRPDDELARIEAKAAAPDFWKDQAEAQKVLQRRKGIEQDRDLIQSLRTQSDDLAVLADWLAAGEPVEDELARGLDTFDQNVQAGEIKKMLGGEHDRKNAIVTIHPGAGGTESQDWAEMLLRMYLRWTERRGFKRDLIDYQPGEEAGLKSATFTVSGDYAFGLMSAEAGVHRLVRISPFDQQARRHTAFASVYGWPQIEDDVDIEIAEKDLRVDTYRSSGAGGQHVNVTDSAVRITHLPTGIVAECQDGRSQHANRASALRVLAARIRDIQVRAQQSRIASTRKRLIGSGDRSERIRTYNFPQGRITDHRINLTLYKIATIIEGDMDELLDALAAEHQADLLAELGEQN